MLILLQLFPMKYGPSPVLLLLSYKTILVLGVSSICPHNSEIINENDIQSSIAVRIYLARFALSV